MSLSQEWPITSILLRVGSHCVDFFQTQKDSPYKNGIRSVVVAPKAQRLGSKTLSLVRTAYSP